MQHILTLKSITQLNRITSPDKYFLFLWNNVYEILRTNYCIPKQWPMGPLQLSLPPLARTSSYATGFRSWSTIHFHHWYTKLQQVKWKCVDSHVVVIRALTAFQWSAYQNSTALLYTDVSGVRSWNSNWMQRKT